MLHGANKCSYCDNNALTQSLDYEADAQPARFVSLPSEVADEEHRHQDGHVKCAGYETSGSARETIATLNGW